MNINFEVYKIRNSMNGHYGNIRVSGSKEFCNRILELCKEEYGEHGIN